MASVSRLSKGGVVGKGKEDTPLAHFRAREGCVGGSATAAVLSVVCSDRGGWSSSVAYL